MSFLKIKDHNKWEEPVKEFLALKNKIKDNFRRERLGEIETRDDLERFFKPITETQIATTKELWEELKPIKEGIESISKSISFPAYPSIEASGGKATQYIGEVAEKYLRKFLTKDEADRDLGIYDKKGDFYISSKPVFIVGD